MAEVRRYRRWLMLAALLAASAAPGAAAGERELTIGWIGPLTGNAATLGADSPAAVELAFDEINAQGGAGGYRLKLAAEDDQYNSARSVAAYEKLVHGQGVQVLMVLTYGGLFALAERAQRDGVLLIDPLDCDHAIAALPENTLCVAKTTEDLGVRIADLVLSASAGPPALLYYDGDPFMGTVAKAMRERLAALGGAVALAETYNDATQDFRSFLTRVKAGRAGAIVFMGYDQTGLAMKQARELGIRLPFYAVAGTMQGPGFRAMAGAAADGVIGPIWLAPDGPRYREFVAGFAARKGRRPYMDLCTVPSYDVARLLADGLRRGALLADGRIDIGRLKRRRYSVMDFVGASGKITSGADGVTRGMEVTTVRYEAGSLERMAAPAGPPNHP